MQIKLHIINEIQFKLVKLKIENLKKNFYFYLFKSSLHIYNYFLSFSGIKLVIFFFVLVKFV